MFSIFFKYSTITLFLTNIIYLTFLEFSSDTDNLHTDIPQLGHTDQMDDVNGPSDIGKVQEKSNKEIDDEAHTAGLSKGTRIIVIAVIVSVVAILGLILGILYFLNVRGHLHCNTSTRNTNNGNELQRIPTEDTNLTNNV